jgi:hypothetical protein
MQSRMEVEVLEVGQEQLPAPFSATASSLKHAAAASAGSSHTEKSTSLFMGTCSRRPQDPSPGSNILFSIVADAAGAPDHLRKRRIGGSREETSRLVASLVDPPEGAQRRDPFRGAFLREHAVWKRPRVFVQELERA